MHQNFGLNQSRVCVSGHSIWNRRCHYCDRLGLFAQISQLLIAVCIVESWSVLALQARVFLVNYFHRREQKVGKNFAYFPTDSVG